MAIKLDLHPIHPLVSPQKSAMSNTMPFVSRAENNPESSPLYFGAKQYKRTILTAEEREQRAQAEKQAAAQWDKMPLLFQVGYEKPGQKIAPGKMHALQTRLKKLPQMASHPAAQEALTATFSTTAPTSALVSKERLALDQIALILDLFRSEGYIESMQSHSNKSFIETMEKIQDASLREALILRMVNDPAPAARVIGAKLLGLLSSPGQQQALAKQLMNDPVEEVATSAIASIALFPGDSQKIKLIKEMTQRSGWWMRVYELANIVGSVEDQTARTKLIHELSRSDNAQERWVAVRSAEKNLKPAPETDAFFERLLQDPSPIVREDAMQNARHRTDEEIRLVSDAAWQRILIAHINDEQPLVRKIAAFHITEIKDKRIQLDIAKRLINEGRAPGNTSFMKILEPLSDREKAELINHYAAQRDPEESIHGLSELLNGIRDERIRAKACEHFFAKEGTYFLSYLLFDVLAGIKNERVRADAIKTAIDMRARQLPPEQYKPIKTYNTDQVSLAPLIAKFENPAIRTELMAFILKHPVAVVRAEALSDDLFLPEYQNKIGAALKNDPSPLVRTLLQGRAPELYSQQARQGTLRELSKEKNLVQALYEVVHQVTASRDAKLQAEILPDAFTQLIDAYVKPVSSITRIIRREQLETFLPDIVVPQLKQQFTELLQPQLEEPASYEQAETLIKQIKETDDITQKTDLLKQWMRFCLDQDQDEIPDIIKEDIFPSLNSFLEEVPYTQIINQALPQLQAVMNEALAEQLRNGKAKDKAFLVQAIPLLSKPGALSAGQLLGTLKTISDLKLDTRILPQALAELARFRLHALKMREQFAPNGQPPMSDEALKQYLDHKTDIILQGILIAGDGTLLDKFDQHQERFELFLQGLTRILQDEDVTQRLYQIKRLPDRHGKQDAYQKTKLIEYCYGFLMLNQKEALLPLLDRMIEQGARDLNSLGKELVKALALKADMPPLQAQTLTEDQLKLFNPDYLHTLPLALRYADYDDHAGQQLKTLLKNVLQGTYSTLLHDPGISPADPSTSAGRANLKTLQEFKELGLNYGLWLKYPKTHTFQIQVDGKPHQMEVKLWDRKPGHDIFQGNYAQACTAMGGENGRAMIDALMHTCVQMVEVRDKTADKTIGKIQTLWVKDEPTGKPALLADNIQLSNPYRGIAGMLEGIQPFMQTLANDVAGQPTTVGIGQNANQVAQLDHLPSTSLEYRVIGDTSDHQLYLSAYPREHGGPWKDIRKARQVKLFRL
jgi:hypothetical protein